MDRDDLDLFEASLRQATERHTGADLDASLAEVGWHDALATDVRAGIATLFTLQGRANATSTALDHVVLDALGISTEHLRPVWPPLGTIARRPATVDRGRVRVEGLASRGVTETPRVDMCVVVASDGAKDVATAVPVADLALRPVGGIDPSLGIVEVTGDAVATDGWPVDWGDAVRRCRLALGHELVGASRAMLDLAREHALARVQFDVPIASFQAVRHRLAETLVAIESAEAVLDAAWQDGSADTAAMAKALAGRGARTAARHCQQVLAGIGFTLEHPFHRYFRRVLVLDELFGSARLLTTALGDDLLRTRRMPPVLPL
jgi:hypothetical protein